ncbi:FAD-binding oxidoreductase [Streptomyces actuosus]|uniref:FAD-binding oxidoreductase n=1 Tax=Streptomyces actuosus TaxID=1885 RepID=A0ABS2VTW5_STRAS|nr:FAD-binding oxidoreductase [Streptomyces actuosus]MBN0046569.1 FAD-binding oxidoreductase [Streptomyces actuosus]
MTTIHPLPDLFLLSEVRGPVLRPDDEGYADEVLGFNLAARPTPDVVVGAAASGDVTTALRWAGATGTPVAVQATGHGANYPLPDGLLITTGRMTDVRVDPVARTAAVSAGATWRDVVRAAAPHGLTGLHGSSTPVGVVGYTLGGGLPVLGRVHGYAVDLVRSFEVVTPDGVPHIVDADHESELFWALRGGKGNVGVVTSLTTGLIPLPRLLGGGIHCPGEQAEPLLRTWAEWTSTVPPQMCTAFSLLRLPPLPIVPEPLRGGFFARVAVAWTGDPAEGDRLLAPLRAAAPVLFDTVEEIGCTQTDRVYDDPKDPLPVREACALLRALPPDAVDTLLARVGPSVPDCPLLAIEIRHMGAALSRPPVHEDAVGARDAAYLLESVGVPAGPEAAAAVESATASLYAAMAPYGTGRTMPNLHGTPGDASDRARAWTPAAYDRLRRVKRTYDPAGLLRYGHTVAPSAA